ncbi:MAG: universal stress protein [Planctomycetales bacterium]
MLRSILVGLDGSKYSVAARELGIHWAKATGALLVGLGIVDEPAILRPEPSPIAPGTLKGERDAAKLHDARRLVEEALEQFTLRCSEAGISSKELEETGSPTEQIIEESQRFDLILLGKQTYFKFETQEGPDQTLTEVLRSSPRPVVTVPEVPSTGNNVLIAYDGSVQAARALQLFLYSGIPVDGECHILSIKDDKVEAAKTGDRAAQYLDSHGKKSKIHALTPHGTDAELILREIAAHQAGMLVMGAFGSNSLQEFIFGSTTRQLLQKSPVPIFLSH